MYTRALVSFLLVEHIFAMDFFSSDMFEDEESGRIVGGYDTSISRHPHQVSLRMKSRHICGAAIIGEQWIVTAAHCIRSRSASLFTIKAGSTKLSGSGMIIRAKRVIVHEDYNRRATDFDIALIQLERNLRFSKNIQPIDLPSTGAEYTSGTMAVVTGWGALFTSGPVSDNLRQVSVPLVASSKCSQLYGRRRISSRMICAGYLAVGGRDACQGDSGGPLVQDGKLIGIVSWGFGCAQPFYPGVYTRVTALRSWISEKTDL